MVKLFLVFNQWVYWFTSIQIASIYIFKRGCFWPHNPPRLANGLYIIVSHNNWKYCEPIAIALWTISIVNSSILHNARGIQFNYQSAVCLCPVVSYPDKTMCHSIFVNVNRDIIHLWWNNIIYTRLSWRTFKYSENAIKISEVQYRLHMDYGMKQNCVCVAVGRVHFSLNTSRGKQLNYCPQNISNFPSWL